MCLFPLVCGPNLCLNCGNDSSFDSKRRPRRYRVTPLPDAFDLKSCRLLFIQSGSPFRTGFHVTRPDCTCSKTQFITHYQTWLSAAVPSVPTRPETHGHIVGFVCFSWDLLRRHPVQKWAKFLKSHIQKIPSQIQKLVIKVSDGEWNECLHRKKHFHFLTTFKRKKETVHWRCSRASFVIPASTFWITTPRYLILRHFTVTSRVFAVVLRLFVWSHFNCLCSHLAFSLQSFFLSHCSSFVYLCSLFMSLCSHHASILSFSLTLFVVILCIFAFMSLWPFPSLCNHLCNLSLCSRFVHLCKCINSLCSHFTSVCSHFVSLQLFFSLT